MLALAVSITLAAEGVWTFHLQFPISTHSRLITLSPDFRSSALVIGVKHQTYFVAGSIFPFLLTAQHGSL